MYMIPKLPQLEIGDDEDWAFTGPLMKALYSGKTLSPRVCSSLRFWETQRFCVSAFLPCGKGLRFCVSAFLRFVHKSRILRFAFLRFC